MSGRWRILRQRLFLTPHQREAGQYGLNRPRFVNRTIFVYIMRIGFDQRENCIGE